MKIDLRTKQMFQKLHIFSEILARKTDINEFNLKRFYCLQSQIVLVHGRCLLLEETLYFT